MQTHSHSSPLLTLSQQRERAVMKFLPVNKKKKQQPRTLTHPQLLQQNHNNNMTETARWPHFSPCDPTNSFIFPPADSVFKDDDSQLPSARTYNSWESESDCRYDSSESDRSWSMRSLMAVLPDSPSPVCSSNCPSPSTPVSFSPSSDAFSSRISTEFSTQTNKIQPCTGFSIIQRSVVSRVEIYEWMETANDFFQPNLQKHQPIVGSMDEKNSSMKIPSICEERSLRGDSGYVRSPSTGDYRLQSRPKPYHTFLDEIRKQEAEAQVGASKKAAQMKFMKKLKGKEAAIRQWESRKTQIAMTKMKKIEDELEKRRTKALDKMQKKISKAQKKANMKKVKERRSIFKKITRAIEAAEIEATQKSTRCLTVTGIC